MENSARAAAVGALIAGIASIVVALINVTGAQKPANVEIRGQVQDTNSLRPVPQAEVILVGRSESDTTDDAGNFFYNSARQSRSPGQDFQIRL